MGNKTVAGVIAAVLTAVFAFASMAPAAAAPAKKKTPKARPAVTAPAVVAPMVVVPAATVSVQPTVSTGMIGIVGADTPRVSTVLTVRFPDGATVPDAVTVVISGANGPLWAGSTSTTGTVTVIRMNVTVPAPVTLDALTITAIA